MVTATLTSKGQITIPKSVRQSLHLETGDRVAFMVHGENEAVIKPVTRTVDQVFGMLHRKGMKPKTVEGMNAAIKERAKGKA